MKQAKLVIFDMDGTLFRTETVDVEAFNKALECFGYKRRSEQEILGLIGLVMEDMCRELLQTEDTETINRFRNLIIELEEKEIQKAGELYSGVMPFLKRLKDEGIILCICSNGNEEYVTSIATKFKFDLVFEEVWFEKKGVSKLEAVGILKEKYKVDNFIMVGDRLCDIEAGKKNGGVTIGVTYGFGGDEAKTADYCVDSIQSLEKTIWGLLGINKSVLSLFP